jgi:hypothetical protein
VIKLVVGILKGAIIGAGVGYGAFALNKATGFESPWITYGVIGALVGLIAGRSIWSLIRDKNATSWVGIVRSVVGFGVGCGLYALVDKVIHPTLMVTIAGEPVNVFAWTVSLGGAIGALWGGFVEIDDAIGADSNADKKAKGKAERELPEAKPAAKRPAGK